MRVWSKKPESSRTVNRSGGNTNRPALKRLLADCRDGKVNVVVVYKLDRLSRSISDFAELTRQFDECGVAFCAVTQDINTATSAGRMMVNILITFAQYEREVIAERIRDKFAASKKKGMWMGGCVPLGYRVADRRLVVVPEEAETVRRIFRRYRETQSPQLICRELNEAGITKKTGKPWEAVTINKLLNNVTYIGKVRHGGELFQGEHEAIVDEGLWKEVHEFMAANDRRSRTSEVTRNSEYVAPLKDILWCGCCSGPMTHYTKRKNNVTYSYYRCGKDARRPEKTCPIRQISAQTVEEAVFLRLSAVLRSPEMLRIVSDETGMSPGAVSRMFGEGFWNAATNQEKHRLCELLLKRVTLFENRLDMEIKCDGVSTAMEELNNG